MTNKIIKGHLITQYGNICMCGGIVRYNNPLTMHHIDPLNQGGETTIANGSLVASLEHSALHIAMQDDWRKWKQIREYLISFKECPDYVARHQFNQWLQNVMLILEMEPCYTKDQKLIYKRRR